MITILHDVFAALCYLLGIGCIGWLFLVMVFSVLRGCVRGLRKSEADEAEDRRK